MESTTEHGGQEAIELVEARAGEVEEPSEGSQHGEHHERHPHHRRRLVRLAVDGPVALDVAEGEPRDGGHGRRRRRSGGASQLRVLPARRAEEGEHGLPSDVVRREHGREHPERPEQAVVLEGVEEDVALREEARKGWEPGDGEPRHDEGGRRDRQELPETPHAPEILFLVHPVDGRPGAEEEERLVEGVGHHEEDRRDIRVRAHRQEHVPEL